MAENTEGMDLTIGLKVDVSAFEKEWEAKYRKQIQNVVGANPVSLKIDAKSIASDLKRVNTEVKKVTGVNANSFIPQEVFDRYNALVAKLRETQEDMRVLKQLMGETKNTSKKMAIYAELQETEAQAEATMRQIQALDDSIVALRETSSNLTNTTDIRQEGIQKRMSEYYKQQEISAKQAADAQVKAAKAMATAERQAVREAERNARAEERKAAQKAKIEAVQERINAKERENQRILNSQVNTLDEMRRKVQLLTAQRNTMPVGSKAFVETQARIDALNASIRKYNTSQKEAATYTHEYNSALRTQKGILNGMPQFLNAYVSVLGATRLVDNIRRVTAEFELQRTALRAIIQDKYVADQLFEKTITQAVESPFTAKELVTYTKQLAAYRIETENLFDTTKMLADVSAGLGVSMDRLILAYGQVRAASVLRGTELRQFSEAGIPLVDLLAENFSLLKDRVVDTNEVFDMISKRQVPFEYVAQVFQELTSKGGMFFDMQRKQSESLYGVYQKLGDQLQLSFYQIGEDNMGALRGAGELALYVAENLDKVVSALTVGAAAWGTYTVAQKLAAMYVGQSNAEMLKEISISKQREANALRVKAAITKLSIEELRRVATAKQLTLADVKSIAASKGYTSAVGARLIATKKITREVAMQAAAELQLTEAQIRQISTLKKWRVALNLIGSGISNVARSLKALAVSMASNPFTWIFAAISGITALVSKSKELKESVKSLQESMFDQAESLEAAYSKAKKVIEDTKSPLKSQISAYETILKKNQDIYPVVKKRLEKVKDEAKQLIILKTTYEDIKRILDDEQAAGFFMKSVKSSEFWYRSFEKDINDVGNEFTNVFDLINDRIKDPDFDSRPYRQLNSEFRDLQKSFIDGDISLQELGKELLRIKGSLTDTKLKNYIDELIRDVLESGKVLEKFAGELDAYLMGLHPEFDFSNLTEEQLRTVQNEIQVFVSQGVANLEDLSAAGKATVLNYIQDYYKIVKAVGDSMNNVPDPDEPDPYGPTPADRLRAELDIMKSAFDQYKKLASALGNGAAFEKVNDAFRELIENFKYLPKDLKVPTSISEYVDILKKALESEATDQKLRVFLKTNISSNEIEDMVNAMKEALAKAKEQVQRSKEANTFYEGLLSSGLGEPVAWQMTMDLYGANPMDIRKQMENNLREAFKEKLQLELPISLSNAENIVKENADKIGKETSNMLLEMIADLRNYDAETIKSLQSNLSKTSELEAKRIKIYRDSAAQIAKLQALPIDDTQKAAMKTNIEQRKKEQLASLGWEEFKAGDLYTTLFSDLDKVSSASLTNLKDKLGLLKDQLKDLPTDQFKEIMSAINKVDKELLERDPFSGIIDNIGALIGGYKRLREAEEEYIQAQNVVDDLQGQYNVKLAERLSLEEMLQQARETGDDTQMLSNMLAQKENEIQSLKAQLEQAQSTARGKKSVADTEQERISNLTLSLSDYQKQIGKIQDAFSEVRNVVELIGVDLEDTTLGALFDGLDAGLKTMQSIISLMQIGWVAIGVGALVGAMTAIFNAKSNALQKQIEALEDKVHSLERAYEKLEEAAEKALGSDLIRVTKEQQANLKQQAEAYRQMYELESQKGKKRDEDKMREYQEQYEDTLAEIQKVQEELVSTLAGSDLTSAARDFARSWVDAYASFSSTTDAMEEKFDEMIKNLIVESLAARMVQNILKPIYDAIDEATSETSKGGASVIESEISDIASLIPTITDSINSSLESLMERLKQQGIDIQKGESNLTGISAAAASITEDTALTLGAIGNNMVYYLVSIHDMLAAKFAAEGAGTDTSAPTLLSVQQAALTELRAIQVNTARNALAAEQIVSALSSVISPVGVKSGAKAINVNI